MKLSDISIHSWIVEHAVKTETGKPLDFRNHLFLFDIFADDSPKQVWLKAAQMGGSTAAILKALWTAKMKHLDIIYTLPTANDVNDFVGGKVNRIIANNPILQQYVKDKDTVEQKRVGENLIYFRGTWVEKAAIMVSSDLNIYDEENRSKQEVIEQYASRLQHSKKKWEWHFSNPSAPGVGASKYWALSDQKHWMVKCPACKHEDYLSWPDSVDIVRREFVCLRCKSGLSSEDRRKGRWVKKFPDREYSGYWLNLMMAPWITADEIIKAHDTKSAEYFANFILGLPYEGEGTTVNEDTFTRNLSRTTNSQSGVVIGCDSGIRKYHVLGNREGLFYHGVTESWDDIGGLLRRYPSAVAVIDAMPDITGPRMLQERFPGRVFLCHYAKDRKTQQLIRWGEGKERGYVLADRNRLIQLLIDEFNDKRIPLQGTAEDWGPYIKHWKTLYKANDTDVIGNPTFKWETSTGEDHWAHATAYWRIGMDRFGGGQGQVIGPHEEPAFDFQKGFKIPPNEKVNVAHFVMPAEEEDYD